MLIAAKFYGVKLEEQRQGSQLRPGDISVSNTSGVFRTIKKNMTTTEQEENVDHGNQAGADGQTFPMLCTKPYKL